MDFFAYFEAGKKCAWLWTCWDLAQKQPNAMEKQISLLRYSSRHIYIKKKTNKTKHKVEWKSNKERNFRNSHGKIKFLENDKCSPFLVVM